MSKMHSNNVSAYCYDEQIRIPVEILRAFFVNMKSFLNFSVIL
jgi:hypothetical protein